MEEKNLETLGGLCSHMLSSPMPLSDDVRECLTQLCVRPTCAAYIVFGMIQKAAKGDTSAAKFIKEINGEGPSLDDAVYEANRVVGTRPDSSRVPAVFRRRPMCRRVLHFTMKLINNNLNEDFELVGAQIFYNLQGRLR